MSRPLSLKQAGQAHGERLNRLLDRGGAARLKKLYDQAEAELQAKLSKAIGRGAAPLTIAQHRAMLLQVKQGMIDIANRLGAELGKATQDTQRDAMHGLIGDMRGVEKHTSGRDTIVPVEEASRFAGVVDRKKTSLLALNKRSMQAWGKHAVGKMEQQLALSLATNETGHEAIDRILKAVDMEWWRAERIARTEQAWAYNATQLDAVKSMQQDFPDMMMRWCELVDDWTLTKLDDRVGNDSVALHGQVAPAAGLFYFPKNPPLPVGDWFAGKSWAHPPNRPNDRAVLQPWRPHWGGFAWQIVNGRKVMVGGPPP